MAGIPEIERARRLRLAAEKIERQQDAQLEMSKLPSALRASPEPARRAAAKLIGETRQPQLGLVSVLEACGVDDCSQCLILFRARARMWFERSAASR